MSTVLRRGTREFEFRRNLGGVSDQSSLDFPDLFAALRFLSAFQTLDMDMRALRRMLASDSVFGDLWGMTDAAFLRRLASGLVSGHFNVVVRPRHEPNLQVPLFKAPDKTEAKEQPKKEDRTPPKQVETRPPVQKTDEKKSVVIMMIGEDNKPVTGEKYRVVHADGTVSEGTLNSDGRARIVILAGETCRVSFPNLDEDAWEVN
jgi:hypothetical protein